MKTVNFWKTLLFSVMALGAFTGCNNDDDPGEEGGLPSITVNGGETVTVAGTYEECTTEAVEVVSTGSWTLTFSDASASWCTPSAVSGSKGTTQLTFKLTATTVDREITATLTTTGSIEGIPLTDDAKIIIKQNAEGSSAVETNVAEVRALVAAMNPTKDKVNVSADILALGNLVGVISGDPSDTPNMGNKYLTVIQDADNAENSGLMINQTNVSSWKTGQILQISLEGAQVQKYNGTLQLSLSNDAKVTVLAEGVEITPVELASVADLEKYQSQLVKFPNVQTATEYGEGETYASNYDADFMTESGESFVVYTNKTGNENFGATLISNLSGPIVGVANCYQKNNEGDVTLQLLPRNADDVAGLTNPRFEIKGSVATIAEVLEGGEGAYKVENATVVATTTRSFVMQDTSGVILVYCNKNTVPEVGSVVTVEGLVKPYSNVLQFDEPTVTVTGTGSVSEPTPTVVDASNIQTIIDARKVVFVQISGELFKDGSYYSMNFSFETSKTGSIESPVASLNIDNYLDQMVDIKGWFIYTTGSGSRFTVVATEISANTTTPSGSFTDAPKTFAATNPEAQTLAYTASEAAGEVSFAIAGTNADKFSVEPKTGEVVVSAVGDNTSDAAYKATLQMKAQDGTVLDEVELVQAAPAGQGGAGKWVKVTTEPSDWSGDYLIVYEEGSLIFDGSLEKLDVEGNIKSVTISGDTIESSAEVDACKFTVEPATDGYAIKSASGFYIYQNRNSNGLSSKNEPDGVNQLALNSDASVQVTGAAGAVLRYNNAATNGTRFRYYKSSSYMNQQPVAFYKYIAE